MVSRKDYALNYHTHEFVPIPLCWVDSEGKCACPKNHDKEKEIGKSPLVSYANLTTVTREMVEKWFTDYPEANIGILIRQSGLVIVDADSLEGIEEFKKICADVSAIPTVKTGRGKHFYFKASPSTPLHRSIHKGKSGALDIFSNGYIVAPPSVHKNGHRYFWENPPKKTGIPNAPKWLETFLTIEAKKKSGENAQLDSVKVELSDTQKKMNLDELPLNSVIKDIIQKGKKSEYYQERRYRSPSEALFGMIIACIEKGLSDDEVFGIFSNPKYELSYKYRENNCSEDWLKGEIERAKARLEAKKNSRSTKTTTPHVSSTQFDQIEPKGLLII